MPTTSELQAHTLKRGEKIRLVDDIPGHSRGSSGKIAVANGMAWKRYWVRFQDGSSVGHVSHHSLVKLNDYDTFVAQRDLEARGGGPAASAEVEVKSVLIPQGLRDRMAVVSARLNG